MKTVIYARTAVENKAALERQLSQCRAYCQTNGLNIIAEISESSSGNVSTRPGLTKLRKLVERGEVEAVVMTSIDRLGRRVDQVAKLVKEIEQAGVVLKLAKGE